MTTFCSGIDKNAQDKEGRSAIHELVQSAICNSNHDFSELLAMFIDNKMNLNLQDKYGKTVLHYAIENQSKLSLEFILLLFHETIDFTLFDNEGKKLSCIC